MSLTQEIIESISNLKKSLQIFITKFSDLEIENEDLKIQLNASNKANEQMLEQLDLRGDRIDKLILEIDFRNEEIIILKSDLNAKSIHEEELEVKINELTQRAVTLEKEIAQMMAKNEIGMYKVKDLGIDKLSFLQNDNDFKSDKIIEELCVEIESLQSSLNRSTEERFVIEEKYNSLKHQLDTLKEKSSKSNNSNFDLELELEKLRMDYENMALQKNQLEIFKVNAIELTQKLNSIDTENEILKSELANLKLEKKDYHIAGEKRIDNLMHEVNSMKFNTITNNARNEIEETIHEAIRIIDKHR
ncbi:MAG: hypothetical protein IPP08_09470 [Chlorobiota bacterium]|nr:MAG: hypothetical protein IPP08_09470 [Chlorobiota bacterium]